MNITRNIYKGLWTPTDKHISSNIFFRRESFFVLAVSILFSFVAGLRILGLDRDYYQYLGGWQELAQGYGTRWEPFFEFLATTIQASFGHESFHFFLVIVAFIGLSIKLNIFSKNKNFALVSFIYLVMLFPIHEMTQVRVALGIAFAYLGLYKATFEKSSFLVRLSYAILAAGSHFSMFVLVPFILIPKIAGSYQLYEKHNLSLGMSYRPGAIESDLKKNGTLIDPNTISLSFADRYRLAKNFDLTGALNITQIVEDSVEKTDTREDGTSGDKIGSPGYDIAGNIFVLSFGLSWLL